MKTTNRFFIAITIMLLLITTTIFAQDDSSYQMWESIMLTPNNANLKVLAENMRTHNQTYHKSGAHKSTVYNITTGPNAGKIIWEMGPLTFTDLDSRPGVGGHDADWRDNVDPYIKKTNTVEYWKADKKKNNTAMLDSDNSKYPILFCRYFEVADGPTPGVNHFFESISKTVKALEGVNPWGVYYNEFRQGDLGRHIVAIGFSPNWADFDRDVNWVETFNKVNGENSWQNQQDIYQTNFKNSWDEIWVYNKEMSGD